MDPFWFDPKRKIDQEYYMEVLEQTVLPWIKSNYESKGIPYVWQQDGAPGNHPCMTSILGEGRGTEKT